MRRINQCQNQKLLALCEKAAQLEVLNSHLQVYLPEALRPHCHVGSFQSGCLLLVVSDSVWATPLRYALPELRDTLRREAGLYQLTSIKITIAIKKSVKPVKKIEALILSPAARKAIQAGAEQCLYPPLQDVLYRLASQGMPSLKPATASKGPLNDA